MYWPPTAHLRSRGEHTLPLRIRRNTRGPPPLARRALAECLRDRFLDRPTSARAERTSRRAGSRYGSPVHLRSRGDHRNGELTGVSTGGSPPLARRPPGQIRGGELPERFTSARAETTVRAVRPRPRHPVHLRSRGDHFFTSWPPASSSGSPPLARRPRGQQPDQVTQRRFTSARAETTRSSATPPGATSVHLRSRGDHHCAAYSAGCAYGSPPLARRPPFATCGVRSALPIRDSKDAGHAPA